MTTQAAREVLASIQMTWHSLAGDANRVAHIGQWLLGVDEDDVRDAMLAFEEVGETFFDLPRFKAIALRIAAQRKARAAAGERDKRAETEQKTDLRAVLEWRRIDAAIAAMSNAELEAFKADALASPKLGTGTRDWLADRSARTSRTLKSLIYELAFDPVVVTDAEVEAELKTLREAAASTRRPPAPQREPEPELEGASR